MSILENFGTFEIILVIIIIVVFLKMIFDVSRFLKKRREYLKNKENQKIENSSENTVDTEFE
jgi:hypothetical protein